jgi:uncharacterized protein YbbC (DUF1343 family)
VSGGAGARGPTGSAREGGGARASLGIDAFLAEPERYLAAGRRVALLTNQAALTSAGVPTLEAVRRAPGVELVSLLTPEHGFSGYEDDATPIGDRRDPRTGLALQSLYGPRRRPTPAALAAVDAVVIDLQDVGVRCYTYPTTAALVCEAAAEAGRRVVLCDRPNPLGPRVDGPMLEPARRSFIGYLDAPFQHGLSMGALVAWGTRGGADLVVAPAAGWEPGSSAPALPGAMPLPFVPPSPGLPTPEAVALYPGLVLLEGTNLNEGRGTTLPFQLLGAPWLDGYALAGALTELGVPGLRFRPVSYVPRSDTHAGETCHGVHLLVEDGASLRPLSALMRILRHVREAHPEEFSWVLAADKPWSKLPGAGEPWHEPVTGHLIDALTGDDSVRRVVEGEVPLEQAQAAWSAAAEGWRRVFG